MSLRIACLIAVALAVAVLVGRWRRPSLNRGKPSPSPTGFEVLEEKANRALGTDPILVGSLLEDLKFGTGFVLSEEAKSRLLQAELSFRAGDRQGPTLASVLEGFNHLVDAAGAPSYMRATETQVEILNSVVAEAVPDLLYPSERTSENRLSPAGGIFLSLVLLRQKVSLNSAEAPDEWLRAIRERRSKTGGQMGTRSYIIKASQTPLEVTAARRRIESMFADPDQADAILRLLSA
jgi:hypothetical protein